MRQHVLLQMLEQQAWARSLPTRDNSLANPVRFDPNLDRRTASSGGLFVCGFARICRIGLFGRTTESEYFFGPYSFLFFYFIFPYSNSTMLFGIGFLCLVFYIA